MNDQFEAVFVQIGDLRKKSDEQNTELNEALTGVKREIERLTDNQTVFLKFVTK